MKSTDGTRIGRVRQVLGSTVTVELSPELAGTAPLWRGRVVPVGQVGSIVRIPQGSITLLGSVVLVGISELSPPLAPAHSIEQGKRWLQVQLLGEVDGLGSFHRGVSIYPGLDDEVHFSTSDDLASVYPPAGAERVSVGVLAAAPDVPLTLDASRLVTRHSAVVGSTGSGKTSAVATLLQRFEADWPSANIVVVDPHGEYASAVGDAGSVLSVGSDLATQLQIPYWALPASRLLSVLCGVESRTVADRFAELVVEARREFAIAAEWLDMEAESITADTPIPYDLRAVWYRLDYDNRATIRDRATGDLALVDSGDAAALVAATFEPHALGNAAPFKGATFGHYNPAPDRLRLRLTDSRFDFFLAIPDPTEPDSLPGLAARWLGAHRPVSVLDFSGVPFEVADVAIGLVLDLLFELGVRSTGSGIGRPRPVLFVLEEAHRYLRGGLAQAAADRIAREGRKYGIGLMMVSQRPSELPETSLAQCGTIIALRLTNGADQSAVRAALPDAVAGLAGVLPSLRTGEALVSGEAVILPTRVQIHRPNPQPQAGDPNLDSWRSVPSGSVELADSIDGWRRGTAPGEGRKP
ncbi:MAG: ATPase [Acidimicrobiales bacterium]|nr:MAG: ATPase [Acidimicrobiales bacterium]